MKHIEKYLERVLKIKPLGTITTERDVLNKELYGERIYVDDIDTGIFIAYVDYLSWVESNCILVYEKQGDKPFDYENANIQQKDFASIGPKFKVGDWVIQENIGVYKIIEVCESWYEVVDNKDKHYSIGFDKEYMCHLWTIQDAKDGDILFQDLMGGKTFIFDGVNPDMAILYSFIISNDGKDVLPYRIGKPNTGIGYIEENKNIIRPATKEQRDLLFSKMHESGYEWDEIKNGC